MPVLYLLPMLIAAQAGRIGGTWLFCYPTGKGKDRLSNRFAAFRDRLETSSLLQKLNERHWSTPFWVAFGRLFWLKFPINIVIAGTKRFRILASGVLISGIVFDGTYIAIGAVLGKNLPLNPIQVLPYFIIGLTLCFISTLVVRQLWQLIRAKLTSSRLVKLLVRLWEVVGHFRVPDRMTE